MKLAKREGMEIPVSGTVLTKKSLVLNKRTTSSAGGESAPSPALPPAVERNMIPAPADFTLGRSKLPDWVQEIRPHQWQAVQEIVGHLENGVDIVWLDAPTGSGKTLIAELVRRVLLLKTLYVCSDKALQDQFVKDFDYAKVLKGRANYTPLNSPGMGITCADCTKGGGVCTEDRCKWCSEVCKCPYGVAKNAALSSKLAVVNTSYLLASANHTNTFTVLDTRFNSGAELIVADECDQLEGELLGFCEFGVSDRLLNTLELTAPIKGAHKPTIKTWIADELVPALKAESNRALRMDEDEVAYTRHVTSVAQLASDAVVVAEEFDDGWVRVYEDRRPLVLKPVDVSRYGDRYLWQHGKQWLCMSATIINAAEMVQSLGAEEKTWEVVSVPMTFPVEHRPIYVSPVALMTKKGQEAGGVMDLMQGIKRIVDGNPNHRILIHTVSYQLTREVVEHLMNEFAPATRRKVFSYTKAREKEDAMRRYTSTPNSIIVAPSFDRGVDFKGDLCRVQIVAKMPNANLGDPVISAKLHTREGEIWYATKTARTLVQSTGRGVRNVHDWCKTYVLDQGFQNFLRHNKSLLPKWWLDGMKIVRPGRLGSESDPVV